MGDFFLIFRLLGVSKLYQNCTTNLWFLGLNGPSGPFRTHEPFLQQNGNIWPTDRSNRPSGLINSWIIDCLDKLFIHLHIFVFLIHLHIFVFSRTMNLLWKEENPQQEESEFSPLHDHKLLILKLVIKNCTDFGRIWIRNYTTKDSLNRTCMSRTKTRRGWNFFMDYQTSAKRYV